MAKLIVNVNVLSSFSTNCYTVYNQETKEAIMIDPPSNAKFLMQMLANQDLKLKGIFLTHGHIDHIGAAEEIKAAEPDVQIYACREEAEILTDAGKNLSAMFAEPYVLEADVYLRDGETMHILDTDMECRQISGHTIGGLCYYFPAEEMVFSGDTLFQGSIGRSDFPTGSAGALIRGIEEKLLTLPDRTVVFPGHGPRTMVKVEKMENPFFG